MAVGFCGRHPVLRKSSVYIPEGKIYHIYIYAYTCMSRCIGHPYGISLYIYVTYNMYIQSMLDIFAYKYIELHIVCNV